MVKKELPIEGWLPRKLVYLIGVAIEYVTRVPTAAPYGLMLWAQRIEINEITIK